MKKRIIALLLALSVLMSLPITASAAGAVAEPSDKSNLPEADGNTLRLWYDEPVGSNDWASHALPLGNGNIGGLTYGEIVNERLHVNEKSLWQGSGISAADAETINDSFDTKKVTDALAAVRAAMEVKTNSVFPNGNGDLSAFASVRKGSFGKYQDLGDIYYTFSGIGTDVENYVRDLDMRTAVSSVNFDYDGVHYEREYLASYPDNVLVSHFTASEAGKLTFTVRMTTENAAMSTNDQTITNVGNNMICLKGSLRNNGEKYIMFTGVSTVGGTVTSNGDGTITVNGADAATIYTHADTDYLNEFPTYRDGRSLDQMQTDSKAVVEAAVNKGYVQVRADHVADHSKLFGRVELNLGGQCPNVPTDELMAAYRAGSGNPAVEEMGFQMGRYMTIAGSRETDVLPTNLCGIWMVGDSKSFWNSDYHFNVNLQMNYFPTMVTNLAECQVPLNTLMEDVVLPGRLAALISAGIKTENYMTTPIGEGNGFMVGTAINPFGYVWSEAPRSWGWNPTGVSWTLVNLYDYYLFTGDMDYLRNTFWPLLKETLAFWDTFLWWSDYQDRLVSSPSVSPEHGPIDSGATCDQSLAWECYEMALEVSEILGLDNAVDRAAWEQKQEDLNPILIGDEGQIKEWYDETTTGKAQAGMLPETTIPNFYEGNNYGADNHRHVAQLIGLYPGTLINDQTPEWMDAAIKTLDIRGYEGNAWAKALKGVMYARTGEGEDAYKMVEGICDAGGSRKEGLMDNLFSWTPKFQVDGNYGLTATVADMLLQSQWDYIHVLPALPDSTWQTGSVQGLMARGNFEFDISWEDGIPCQIDMLSKNGGTAVLEFEVGRTMAIKDSKGASVPYTVDENGRFVIATTAGETYTITNEKPVSPVEVQYAMRQNATDIIIAWNDHFDAAGYNVYRSCNDGDYQLVASNVSALSFTDTTAIRLTQTDRYAYCVAAVDRGGYEGLWSESVEETGEFTGDGVESITVTSNTGVTLLTKVGQTVQLSAEVLPETLSNRAVTWTLSSRDGGKAVTATIDENGLVTATAAGSETVIATAMAKDGSGTYGTIALEVATSANGAISSNYFMNQTMDLIQGTVAVSGRGASWVTNGDNGVYAPTNSREFFNTSGNTDVVLELDWGYERKINRVDVYERTDFDWDAGHPGEGDPRIAKVLIQTENDNGEWKTVAEGCATYEKLSNYVIRRTMSFDDVEADSVRVVLEHHKKHNVGFTIWEIEAYYVVDASKQGDRAELYPLLEKAALLLESDFSGDGWTTFTAAREDALAVANELSSDQTAVDAAVAALSSAMAAVENPTPEVTNLRVDVPSTILGVGDSMKLVVTAEYDRGDAMICTDEAVFACSGPVSITGNVVTATGSGNAVVTVSYGGKSATVALEIRGLPNGELRVYAEPGGIVKSDPKGPYSNGVEVVLTAVPDAGCNFLGWKVNGEVVSTETVYTVIVGEVSEVYALFEKTELAGYTNVALNKDVTSTTPDWSKWAPVKVTAAVDGNLTTNWGPDHNKGKAPANMTVDLGASYSIEKVRLIELITDRNPTHVPKFTMEVSATGADGDWQTVLTDAGADAVLTLDTPAEARYVRIEVVSGDSSGDCNIAEFEVYAKVEEDTSSVTVTFNANNGTDPVVQPVKVGTKVDIPTRPVKEGYAFAGWYSDSQLFNRYDFEKPVAGNLGLYAKWLEVQSGQGNLALNKPVTSPTPDWSQWGAYTADSAVDGSLNTNWGPDHGKGASPAIMTVDLEGAYRIASVKVLELAKKAGLVQSYKVEVSTDNLEWETVIENGTAATEQFFEPVDACFVRLTITKASGDANIAEFEVYAASTETYNVTYALTNITADSQPATMSRGETLTTTLTAAEGYILPKTIAVTMGSQNAVFTYSKETGSLTVKDITGDVVITAEGVAADAPVEKHTVTFNTNGGSEIAAVEVEDGEPVAKPANPTKSDCVFVGWYSNEALTTAYDFTDEVTDDITLHAKWLEVQIGQGNLALNKPVTSPTPDWSQWGAYTAASAVDGILNTNWGPDHGKGALPAIMTVDLEGAYRIVSVKVLELANKAGLVQSYKVEVSTDNQVWQTVIENGTVAAEQFFEPVVACFVRLTITSASGDANVAEFEVYSDRIGAITSPMDYQILQRDSSGTLDMTVSGSVYVEDTMYAVLLDQDNEEVCRAELSVQNDKTASVTLNDVETGMYTLNMVDETGKVIDTVENIGVGDLWLVAGQSNAAGYGNYLADEDVSSKEDDPPMEGVHSFTRVSPIWKIAQHTDVSTGNKFGLHTPILAFAKAIKEHTGVPIGLVNVAVGGSKINTWQTNGVNFKYVQNAAESIAVGKNFTGVFWYQGETDAMDATRNYDTAFKTLVTSYRDYFKNDDLVFITAQLNSYTDATDAMLPNWYNVKELQRQFADPASSNYIENLAVISTTGMRLGDNIHNSANSNVIIGNRMAKAALALAYGEDVAYGQPNILRAEASGTTLTLTFGNVGDGLKSSGNITDFTVRDNAGAVAVTNAVISGTDKVVLTLGRSLDANPVVDALAVKYPVPTVFNQLDEAILTFYAFPITDSTDDQNAQDQAAADAVEDLIDALPAADEVELSDEEAIEAARAAYDALTDAQKALVENQADLEAAEDALEELKEEAAEAALAQAKEEAKAELAAYRAGKDDDDYRDAQVTELNNAVTAGNAAIDAATTEVTVATALSHAKAALDAVKTDAELDEEEADAEAAALAQAKEDAKEDLADYRASKADADYRDAQVTELNNAVTAGEATIDAAETEADVAEALADAKAALDAVKTDAELDEEEDNEKPSWPIYPGTPSKPSIPAKPVKPVKEFTFKDVDTSDWYYDEVKDAFENGLIDGITADSFAPNKELTVAQAIKLAAALHQLDKLDRVTLENGTDVWYSTYVRYAVANEIIGEKYADYTKDQMNAPISREEFVHIFHGAMEFYAKKNDVADNAIPDVKLGNDYADEIYTFYRAGILTGSDSEGTFNPDSSIKRSEVAAILIRMYDTTARQSITLK